MNCIRLSQRAGTSILTLTTLITLSTAAVQADGPPAWDRQAALQNGWIYDDFDAGIAKGKETGKPLMVVLRCPP